MGNGAVRRLIGVALLATLMAGCATFPDDGPREWREKVENSGELGGPPAVRPEETDPQTPPANPGDPGQPGLPDQPDGCTDPDPQVVATCLAPIGAIAPLPDGESALVGERSTGRILRVKRGTVPRLVTTIAVDAAGGGGLTGLVLSPSYSEDRLAYAYATTASGHEVLRIAPDEPPEPILSGIPKGPRHNRGALGVDPSGALIVATGDAGTSPDPASLAGKLLRIDTLGRPAAGNPQPGSPIFSTGVQAPGGICTDPRRHTSWITDRRVGVDGLYRVAPGVLEVAAWTWPDRPDVAGCIAHADLIGIAQPRLESLYVLRTMQGRTFTGSPEVQLAGRYGRLSAVSPGLDGSVWLGTVNKDGGAPVSSDDRVIKVQIAGGAGSGDQA
ncbi:PQQ-dependent sugar dehydrogenase [Pseudonocardia sp.]|uniref:PQQ-dependent sugar dehydrogenase n=1 Tax=Pseudonocardia sp. TaxID=60912 RepID=UPI003D145477